MSKHPVKDEPKPKPKPKVTRKSARPKVKDTKLRL